ncbi:uncharacterized protein VTP21DRAFT_9391 [Calcarisporiella thermophila]|uniref:uncharacterized protein n=1 Tax=Calcarisporiella thermophila TaxID=911321 RepID=UPI0037444250
MSEVFVTLVANDRYVQGGLVLGHALRDHGTTHRLVCMITPLLSPHHRDTLAQVWDELVEVPPIHSRSHSNLRLLGRPDLSLSLTKLHAFHLPGVRKFVFLDADTLPLRNVDELFSRPDFSAAPDAGWPDCFNSGVFVAETGEERFQALMSAASDQGSFDGGDQGLLNSFFSQWSTSDVSHRLPFIYNTTPSAAYSYSPAYRVFRNDIAIVHYIGTDKPWLWSRFSDGSVFPRGNSQDLVDLVQKWWNVYDKHYPRGEQVAGPQPDWENIKVSNVWDVPDILEAVKPLETQLGAQREESESYATPATKPPAHHRDHQLPRYDWPQHVHPYGFQREQDSSGQRQHWPSGVAPRSFASEPAQHQPQPSFQHPPHEPSPYHYPSSQADQHHFHHRPQPPLQSPDSAPSPSQAKASFEPRPMSYPPPPMSLGHQPRHQLQPPTQPRSGPPPYDPAAPPRKPITPIFPWEQRADSRPFAPTSRVWHNEYENARLKQTMAPGFGSEKPAGVAAASTRPTEKAEPGGFRNAWDNIPQIGAYVRKHRAPATPRRQVVPSLSEWRNREMVEQRRRQSLVPEFEYGETVRSCRVRPVQPIQAPASGSFNAAATGGMVSPITPSPPLANLSRYDWNLAEMSRGRPRGTPVNEEWSPFAALEDLVRKKRREQGYDDNEVDEEYYEYLYEEERMKRRERPAAPRKVETWNLERKEDMERFRAVQLILAMGALAFCVVPLKDAPAA